jgi:glycosyltransferase involved in cell wall biosynthesis
VVLTEKAREVLFPESAAEGFDKLGRPVEVIPCCVDFEERFQFDYEEMRADARNELDLNGRMVMTHLGALGGLYLTEEIADCLQAARKEKENVFAMFLTQTDPDLIIPLLRERGFTEKDFFVGRVAPAEVPRYLCASDIALSIVKATYATISRSPTKIPEYLAAGLPIISNRGVGDVDELIINDNVGALLDDFSAESYSKAVKEILALKESGIGFENFRTSAKNRYDLKRVGGVKYRRIYTRILDE